MLLIIMSIKQYSEVLIISITRTKKWDLRCGRKEIIIVCILYNCLPRKLKEFNKKTIRNKSVGRAKYKFILYISEITSFEMEF